VPVRVKAFYESQLRPHASTVGHGVSSGSRLGAGAGLLFVPVEHDHRAARSAEEARLAAEIVEELLCCRWTDEKGREASLTADDILLVAPYNAQVAELARAVQDRLGFRPRAGTVDKFQGQEAAVVLYSMATSSPEDAPREPGVPVLAEPAERGGLAGALLRGGPGQPEAAGRPVPHAGADAGVERVLPVAGGVALPSRVTADRPGSRRMRIGPSWSARGDRLRRRDEGTRGLAATAG
jgi:hypothetical protein